MQRREFLTLTLQTGAVTFLLNPLACRSAPALSFTSQDSDFPLRAIQGDFDLPVFNGDNPTGAHTRLWNLEDYIKSKGGRPAVSETREVVIVGGGIAGLTSAYHLRSLNPLVIEQADQFGGNSKGESYQGLPFTMAASYIGKPERGTKTHSMLETIGALRHGRSDRDDADLGFRKGFGFGAATGADWDANTARLAKRIDQDLRKMAKSGLPTIPWQPGGMSRQEVEALDRMSFGAWLKKTYGAELTVPLKEYFELYCWGAFAGSGDELSAAQVLNFLASETYENWAFPGGNAFVAQKLYEYLSTHLSSGSLRANQMVLEVKVVGEQVQILVDQAGSLKTIACKNCVMAAPKRIAKKIVPQLSPAQKDAVEFMKWRAYVVANVLVRASIPVDNFGYYRLEGTVPVAQKNSPRAFVDFTLASWANGHKSDPSILTLYRPLPFDEGSRSIFEENSQTQIRAEMQTSVAEILKAMNIDPGQIGGMRISRFGHALPLAKPEFLARHHDRAFKEPTLGRIHYANQDNDCSPSFECAVENAERVASQIAFSS